MLVELVTFRKIELKKKNMAKEVETRPEESRQPGRNPLNEGIQPVLVKFSDIKPEKLSWLWVNRIPMGKLILLVGDPGTGKSFLTIFMAAQVSTGRPWPDPPDKKVEEVLSARTNV